MSGWLVWALEGAGLLTLWTLVAFVALFGPAVVLAWFLQVVGIKRRQLVIELQPPRRDVLVDLDAERSRRATRIGIGL